MKFRIFPNEEEKVKIHKMLNQYRWYYNAILQIFYDSNMEDPNKILEKNKYSMYDMRDLLNKHSYERGHDGCCAWQSFNYDEERNSIPIPSWWEGQVHSRLPRGAVCKFTSSLNSAISNFKTGNIKKLELKYRSSKNPTDYLHFEDKSYPTFINKIKSHFWFRSKDHKRTTFSFANLQRKRSLEIIYEKETDRYFLHTPVETNFFPEEDLRSEKQATLNFKGERVISLDPGVRKFMVGYDPQGFAVFIGDRACSKLTKLLLEIDKRISLGEDSKKQIRYVKNLVNELHWKTISFLIENYDFIMLPDFRVQQMIKGKKLPKMVKRLMMMFSFHTFKERLMYKCKAYNKTLMIVDESYTSCTCGNCGIINRNLKSSETFECECGLNLDRDVNGARNIFLKNLKTQR